MIKRKYFCVLLLVFSLLIGSAASSSAFSLGDVDDDGVARLADFLLVWRYFAGTSTLTYDQLDACNVSGGGSSYDPRSPDAKCSITDAILILKKANGIIT